MPDLGNNPPTTGARRAEFPRQLRRFHPARTAGGGRTGWDCEGAVLSGASGLATSEPPVPPASLDPSLHSAAVNARDTEAGDREPRLLTTPHPGARREVWEPTMEEASAPAARKAPQCPPRCPVPGGDAGRTPAWVPRRLLTPALPPGLSQELRRRAGSGRLGGIIANKQGPGGRRCSLGTEGSGGRRGGPHAGPDPEAPPAGRGAGAAAEAGSEVSPRRQWGRRRRFPQGTGSSHVNATRAVPGGRDVGERLLSSFLVCFY